MKFEEFVPLAQRTSPEGHNRTLNGVMGLIGECGEVADLVKKWLFQSGENGKFPKEKMIGELGDVMWYTVELCTGLGHELKEYHMIPDEPRRILLHEFAEVQNVISEVSMMMSIFAANAFKILHGSGYLNVENHKYPKLPRKAWNTVNEVINVIIECVKYLANNACGCSIEEIMERNIEKLKKRYPDGFEAERSVNRAAYEGTGDE